MNNYSDVFQQITLNTEVIYANNIRKIRKFESKNESHLHVLGAGKLRFQTSDFQTTTVTAPAMVFVASGADYKILSDGFDSTELVCATIKLSNVNIEELAWDLPKLTFRQFDVEDPITVTINWLLKEVFSKMRGPHLMLEKMADIFVFQLLRDLVNHGVVQPESSAGAIHPRLIKVIKAINQAPEKQWSLDSLASLAALSRSKFSGLFKQSLGQTPIAYITMQRLAVAQEKLIEGKSIAVVANEVGYEHASALARVFKKQLGLSPTEWRQRNMTVCSKCREPIHNLT